MSQTATDLQQARADSQVMASTLRALAASLIAAGVASELGGL